MKLSTFNHGFYFLFILPLQTSKMTLNMDRFQVPVVAELNNHLSNRIQEMYEEDCLYDLIIQVGVSWFFYFYFD